MYSNHRVVASPPDSDEEGTEILDNNLRESELIFRARNASSDKEESNIFGGGMPHGYMPQGQQHGRGPSLYEGNAVYQLQNQNMRHSDAEMMNMMGINQSSNTIEENKFDGVGRIGAGESKTFHVSSSSEQQFRQPNYQSEQHRRFSAKPAVGLGGNSTGLLQQED